MADDIQRQILEELKKLNERADKSDSRSSQSTREVRAKAGVVGSFGRGAAAAVSPLGAELAGSFKSGGVAGAAGTAGKAVVEAIQSVLSAGSRAQTDVIKSASGLDPDSVVEARAAVKKRFAQDEAAAGFLDKINAGLGNQARLKSAQDRRELNKLTDPFQRTEGAVRGTVNNAVAEFSRATGAAPGDDAIKELINAVRAREEAVTSGLKKVAEQLGKTEADFLNSPEVQARVSRF